MSVVVGSERYFPQGYYLYMKYRLHSGK